MKKEKERRTIVVNFTEIFESQTVRGKSFGKSLCNF